MAYSLALDNIYSHYLTTYAPKSSGRYDAHGKDELRNVYKSIMKLNKEAPVSIYDRSEGSRTFAVEMKENAMALRNTIASIGGLNENQILTNKIAFSSDNNIAEANYIGSAEDSGPDSFTLNVEKLALPQINTGSMLPSDEMDLAPGLYSFDVSINHTNYEFQFNINEDETNLSLQNKLARLINNSDIGLNAEVLLGEGESSLRLTSVATGSDSVQDLLFYVSDDNTSKARGAVDYLGIGDISQAPENAEYFIDNVHYTNYSNTFTVNKMYEVTLKSANPSAEGITIGLKADTEALHENVNRFVSGYNDFLSNVNKFHESQPGTNSLIREMNRLTSTYSRDLGRMGMNISPDGQIDVDDEKLVKTLTDSFPGSELDSVKKFTSSVLAKANKVSYNPMDYVPQKIVAYKNPGKGYTSPYVSSPYSGMIFNGYC